MSKELQTRRPNRFLSASAKLAPVFGTIGLLLVGLDFTPFGPNAAGATLLSRPLYGVFLAIALLALWIAPSQSSDWKVKPSAWWWADVMVCTYIFVPIMQWTIPSPRPPGSPIEELLGLPLGGWPSGHMVSVFALSWALMVARPRLAWPAFALAIAMSWARIESSAHYPFQVICGGALGMALGWWTTHHREGLLLTRVYDVAKRKLAGPRKT